MSLAIITGSSAGLGYQTALQLASRGFDRIVITSRDFGRANIATERLKAQRPATDFLPYELQLHDLDATQKFAEKVMGEQGIWNLLVNNAGAKIERPTKLTKQGFEWHYGVNHLAHFALTFWLKVSAAEQARVVSNASIAASKGLSELWRDAKDASPSQQYCSSKLANVCFGLELNQRSRLASYVAHPGFARAEPYGNGFIRFGEYLFAQSAKSGAKPLTEASVGDYESGSYLAPKYFELWGEPEVVEPTSKATQENRNLLWQLSEKQLGFRF